MKQTIIYTMTDEAPFLASFSLLPIFQAFAKAAGIDVKTTDISLAGRILANFPEVLKPEQKQADDLSYLGELAQKAEANIIKLPNISASVPQLKAAIKELQSQGYSVPDFPENPTTETEKQTKSKYTKVLGSAVNPVIREGNSDRRVAASVKAYARANPHSMGAWDNASKTHVAHMKTGDFFGNEQSKTISTDTNVKIEFISNSGEVSIWKDKIAVTKYDVVDASFMSVNALREYYEKEISDAKSQDLLLSIHLKATMMKVSDPILFGHAVSVYFKDVFEKYTTVFKELGVNPNNGLAELFTKIETLPTAQKQEILNAIKNTYEKRPALAMVDSDKGITNLHVPNNVIIDASMPAAIRSSGKMWNAKGKLEDTKALIPDRCYAGVYEETIQFCKKNGAFDPRTMGSVANVGLMAQKAEEYGSHDKTFEAKEAGTVKVIDTQSGATLLEHTVQKGDVWRMCQTKDIAIKDWVKLGVTRARLSKTPVIFWLDKDRAHDREVIQKVNEYLKEHDLNGLDIKIQSPVEAVKTTLERTKKGQDTISATGNVLRDYLTDLFPILELGTSAKMLSIVPLLAGGGLFETGAGGSAPKHVEQFLDENHLRWDSLGEYLAIAVSLEDLGQKTGNKKSLVLAKALDEANGRILQDDRSPKRDAKDLDTRGSHFYLALYWAQALAKQSEDAELKKHFTPIAEALTKQEKDIVSDLNNDQGRKLDIRGYYHPDTTVLSKIMRPSDRFNQILN